MTADHARKIADAIENRDRAARNLDNAAKMPERGEDKPGGDAMLASAGAAYAEAQTVLTDLLRAEPVEMATLQQTETLTGQADADGKLDTAQLSRAVSAPSDG